MAPSSVLLLLSWKWGTRRMTRLGSQLDRMRAICHDYPSQFWILILGAFIDHVGGALI